ncbi:O-antigen ligase [Rhodococcus sp. 14-2470-1b]|uniref:O-antigen ligase family protein n=1 Tax=Rhodococcus sp. 14-2470-1b TaxID=2023149 RepID=UPI0011400BC0|nr:O-antigen ligase family protein [Rhodococcus sp. 14-2470-1b]
MKTVHWAPNWTPKSSSPSGKRWAAVWVIALVFFSFLLPALMGWLAALAIISAIAIFSLSVTHPKFALTFWLVVCCFVPFWIGVDNPFYLPASSLAGLVVLGGAFARNPWRLSRIDTAVLLVCGLCLICGLLGLSRPGDVTNVITQWLLSFVLGRLLVQRAGLEFAYRTIAIVFSAAAACAVIEFIFDWNPYYSWAVNNTQYLAWGHEQERGGIVRAEWAFGHSIALGCSLAMAIPMVFACSLRPLYRVTMAALLVAGTVASFSRSGMLTAVIAVVLSLVFYSETNRTRGKLAVILVLGVVAWFAVPQVMSVFAEEGRRATISSDYRVTLIDLIPSMNPIGLASGYAEPSPGVFYFQGFKSIDSTFVLLGVSFGYAIAAFALAGCVWLALKVARRTSSAAAVGLLAVVPALFTVALITQFGSIVWFYLGIVSLYDWKSRNALREIVSPSACSEIIGEKRVDHKSIIDDTSGVSNERT